MAQSIPCRSGDPTEPSSGSKDTNLIAAGVARSASIRLRTRAFSTDVPSQTLGNTQKRSLERTRAILLGRLVSTWNWCHRARSITCQTRKTKSIGTASWNKSDIELTKIRRGSRQDRGASSECWRNLQGAPRRAFRYSIKLKQIELEGRAAAMLPCPRSREGVDVNRLEILPLQNGREESKVLFDFLELRLGVSAPKMLRQQPCASFEIGEQS
jgi:hypothetical protein